jgi:hypothetical protein
LHKNTGYIGKSVVIAAPETLKLPQNAENATARTCDGRKEKS